jgi:transposase
MVTVKKQSVGLDMAKDKFDACFCVLDEKGRIRVKSTRSFPNTKSGFADLDKWVAKWQEPGVETVFVMEATGVYYENLAWHLHQQGRNLSVVLPNLAKKYLQSLGHKSKNDKADAKGLAHMGAERALAPWRPLSPQLYLLRKLTREREQISKARTGVKNLLHAERHTMLGGRSTVRRLEKTLALLERQLAEIDRELEAAVSQDEALKAKIDQITSVKGLGLLTAVTIVAETNGFALFKNQRQLVSFAGYDVVENQSGKRAGKTRISKKGNSHIRRSLFMPAFNTVRYGLPVFTQLYERLLARGRTKMQAYVALQKKLLVLVYTLWRKDEPYLPQREETAAKATSENGEPELLSSVGSGGDRKKVAPALARATQDEHPVNESPEVLSSVELR